MRRPERSSSCSLMVTSSASSAGVRKSSSMSMSTGVVVPQASSVAQGGSLKKESLANLHLLSATNEGKLSQQEIKQQIPVKLSSKLSVSASTAGGSKVKKAKVCGLVFGLSFLKLVCFTQG